MKPFDEVVKVVTTKIGSEPELGVANYFWSFRQKQIEIDASQVDSVKIVNLAHELGHVISWKWNISSTKSLCRFDYVT